MAKIGALVRKELEDLLPVWFFFFGVILVIEIYKALLFRQYGVPVLHPAGFSSAVIGAAIVAKIFLIVDHIPAVERFSDRPIFYVVLWKTAIYTAASVLLEFVEEWIKVLIKGRGIGAATRSVIQTVSTPHFWAVQIIVITSFFSFIMLREIVRAIGKERFRALMLGERKPHSQLKRAA